MKSGFLLVDKPETWTSFDVCAKLRGLLKAKNQKSEEPKSQKKQKIKIGHTGTLDPFATGFLIIAVGKATKLIPYFEKDRKVYETEIILGATTETLDSTSEIIEIKNQRTEEPKLEMIENVLKEQFTGKIEQLPPKYSALKVDGQRAYDLARKGEEVKLESRETEVFSIKILEYSYPRLKLSLDVAAGFYVRALARDLGEALGSGGYCESLRRTGIGNLRTCELENLITEKHLNSSLLQSGEKRNASQEGFNLIDPREILPHIPVLEIESGRFADFREGRAFPVVAHDKPETLVTIEGQTVGLGEVVHGKLQPRILLI
ncbi:MAG TPA: tRNA pseudouridine(55) synthase TruB [Candidatus Gracilibacteria bacterium]